MVVGGSCKTMYAESLSALPRVILSLSLAGCLETSAAT